MDSPHEKVLMYTMEENQKLRKLLKSARAELWHSYNRGSTRPLLTLIDKIDDQLHEICSMGKLKTYQDFLERKVDQCIMLWKYGKNTTEQFKISMVRLGYDEEDIQESLDDYFNT